MGEPLPIPKKGTYAIAKYMRLKDRFVKHAILRQDNTYRQVDNEKIITNIFLGFDLGSILISAKDGKYFIIGGGHRLYPIRMFMQDEMKALIPTTNDMRLYSQLSAEDKDKFDKFKLNLIIYKDLTPRQIEDICTDNNHHLPTSHGELVQQRILTAPMCHLAFKLSETHRNTLSKVKHVVGTKGGGRVMSYSWTIVVLANFHHGRVLYGRKLTPIKNKELCESLRSMPIDEQRLTREFEKLMAVIDSKQTNLKYPSYVLATVQAIMLTDQTYSAEEVAGFLDDMLVNIRSGPLRTRWDMLAHTKGLDPNLPSSCGERVNIFLDWRRRDSNLLPTLPDDDDDDPDAPDSNSGGDSDADSDSPSDADADSDSVPLYHVGDFVWVNSEGPSDKCELARIIACFPDGSYRIEWWYRGWKSKPCASIPDEAWSVVTEEDLVLDNDRIDIIDGDCIEEHADRYVHEKARKKFMWTRPAPGRKQVYKVIDTIRKKDLMWKPSPDQRAFARTQFEDPAIADTVIDGMVCDDYRDFIKQLNNYLAFTESRKRKRE